MGVSQLKTAISKRVNTELDMMIEIGITQDIGASYKSLFSSVPEGLAGYRSIVAYLNKSTSGSRIGFLDDYTRANPQHFVNGVWQAKNLQSLVEFTCARLLDNRFVKKANKIMSFRKSMNNLEWVMCATKLIGFKMLERNYDRMELKSKTANQAIEKHKELKEFQASICKSLNIAKKNPSRMQWAAKNISINHSKSLKTNDRFNQMRNEHYETLAFAYNKPEIDHLLTKEIPLSVRKIAGSCVSVR